MLSQLYLANIDASEDIKLSPDYGCFVLSTCQRKLVLGFNETPLRILPDEFSNFEAYRGRDAYKFLLETICGLQSKILAEYEIVSQFKKAYSTYLEQEDKTSHLMAILEKLFKDAKEVRSTYLLEIGSNSYAGIARKMVQNHMAPGSKVLITGSGALAEDTIKIMYKKYDLYISARNSEKIGTLCNSFGVRPLEWPDLDNFTNFSAVINTIGTDTVLYDQEFFQNWHRLHSSPIFIDMGSPSCIESSLSANDGLYRLDDVFKMEEILNKKKELKVKKAKDAIEDFSNKRQHHFSLNVPFGWEELNFG